MNTPSGNDLERYIKAVRGRVDDLCQSHPRVMESCDALLTSLRKLSDQPSSLKRILDALSFSADRHRQQSRKDWEATPYIIHPMMVTQLLLTDGCCTDPDILIAALLHDTVEDTSTTLDELAARYGDHIASLVGEMTDDTRLPWTERKRLQIVNASLMSKEGALIKLADKYCNLMDLMRQRPKNWSQARADDYFNWAQQVVDSLPPINKVLKSDVDRVIQKYRSMEKAP